MSACRGIQDLKTFLEKFTTVNNSDILKIMAQSRSLMSREHRIATSSMRSRSIHSACSNPNLRLDHGDWTHKCEEAPIVDQKETGTCWMQAGLTFLATLALKKGYRIRFSSAYLAFYDKLEKARVFLQEASREDIDERTRWHWIHDDPIQDGGTWGMFIFLVKKYGLISHESFSPTYQSAHSSQLNGYLNVFLKGALPLIRQKRTSIDTVMVRVHDALLRAYSLPPEIVRLNKKVNNIDFVGLPTSLPSILDESWDCTVLTHAPDRPNGIYIGPYSNDPRPGGMNQDTFYVVDVDALCRAIVLQLELKRPVWFTADVHYDFSSTRGLGMEGLHDVAMLLGLDQPDRHCKINRMKNHNTAPVHAMLFTGVKLDTYGTPTQWRVQNSWGKRGVNEGFVTVSQAWFESHVFQAAIDTRLLPGGRPPYANQTPVRLPPWDIFATVATF